MTSNDELRKLAEGATQGEWRTVYSRYYCDYKDCTNKTRMVTHNCSTGEETYSCSGHDNQNWSILIGIDTYKPDDKNRYPQDERYIYTGDAEYIAAANPTKILSLLDQIEMLNKKLQVARESLTSIASLSRPRHDNAKYWQGLSREQCAIVVAKDTQIARLALKQIDEEMK